MARNRRIPKPSTRGLRIKRSHPRYGTETHCPNGHEFSEFNTVFQENGSRECKFCKRNRCRLLNRRRRGAERGLQGKELEDYVHSKVSEDKARAKFELLSAMWHEARAQKR